MAELGSQSNLSLIFNVSGKMVHEHHPEMSYTAHDSTMSLIPHLTTSAAYIHTYEGGNNKMKKMMPTSILAARMWNYCHYSWRNG